jgi:histidinol-phosphate aminotransferase
MAERVIAGVLPRVRAMMAYTPGEQPSGGELVKLNTNENPYPPSPTVAEAVRAVSNGDSLRLYPQPASDDVRAAAAAAWQRPIEGVLIGNGSDELLSVLTRACLEPGQTVAWLSPTYSLYRTMAEAAGARVVELPVQREADHSRALIDEDLAKGDPRLIFVCRPNSPWGETVGLDELGRLCRSTDALVVADEAYIDFSHADSALEILDQHQNLVVLRTLSKAFSLAGVRIGIAFATPDLVVELDKLRDSYNVSRLNAAAAVAALQDMDIQRANCDRVMVSRQRVIERLRAVGWEPWASDANFFWLPCPGDDGRAVYSRLADAGVLVRWFDSPGLSGGVRITVGTDEQMDLLVQCLGNLN